MSSTIIIESDFFLRLISLLFLLALFIFLWYKSKDIDYNLSYYHLLLYFVCRYITLVFVFASPFLFLLTSSNISFEIYVYFLAVIYLIGFVLGFGLLMLYSKNKIFYFFNKEAYSNYREKKKYNR